MAVQIRNTATFPTRRPLDFRVQRTTNTGGVRLRMDPTSGQHGALDGAWWPYTNDLVAELPALIAGVDAWLAGRDPGRSELVSRVAVGWHAWNQIPDRTEIGGRRVQVGWFSNIDVHTVSVSCPNGSHYDLLVVPPDSLHDAAASVMTRAADARNELGGSEILLRQAGRYDFGSLPVDAWHDPDPIAGQHSDWEIGVGGISDAASAERDPLPVPPIRPPVVRSGPRPLMFGG